MSDHLSECCWTEGWPECICPDLRTYGEKMRTACIAAVKALVNPEAYDGTDFWLVSLNSALAALKEVQP